MSTRMYVTDGVGCRHIHNGGCQNRAFQGNSKGEKGGTPSTSYSASVYVWPPQPCLSTCVFFHTSIQVLKWPRANMGTCNSAPHRTALHHTTPHHQTTLHQTTPHHTTPSHHNTPHHTIPHHTTPHHHTRRQNTPAHLARPLRGDRLVRLDRDGF